ncbi:MAG: threonine synthase, partial [Crocinitomicaceae bacterium]|nr:threonine synthase [Crocinitomicaceae bacterium]
GIYRPKSSVETYANAMDVGNPSNFERIEYIYENELRELAKDISAYSYSNDEIINEIDKCYEVNRYLLDPHGAIGKMALLDKGMNGELGVFLATAHPKKFSKVITKAVPDYREEETSLNLCHKKQIKNEYSSLKSLFK